MYIEREREMERLCGGRRHKWAVQAKVLLSRCLWGLLAGLLLSSVRSNLAAHMCM